MLSHRILQTPFCTSTLLLKLKSFYSSSLRLIGNWLIMKVSNTHFVETISGYIHMGVASFCREYLCWIVLVVGSD